MEGRYGTVKRILDMIGAILLLVIFLIPMLIIGLLICLTSSGGAIFCQKRVGKDGIPFCCYKFRTMERNAPQSCPTAALTDADRYITPVGRWLRRTSLDELPQLWNVLRGEMSLVGPRPLIPEEEWIHRMRRRIGVEKLRPGITGLAQIRGRDLLGDGEKVRIDASYARRISFRTDAEIILQTLGCVTRGANIREGAAAKR